MQNWNHFTLEQYDQYEFYHSGVDIRKNKLFPVWNAAIPLGFVVLLDSNLDASPLAGMETDGRNLPTVRIRFIFQEKLMEKLVKITQKKPQQMLFHLCKKLLQQNTSIDNAFNETIRLYVQKLGARLTGTLWQSRRICAMLKSLVSPAPIGPHHRALVHHGMIWGLSHV